jgi:hypothetical protein
MKRNPCPVPVARRGNATVVSVIVLFVIGSLAGVVLSVSHRHSAEVNALADQNRAFFVAQTGVNQAVAALEEGDSDPLGSAENPVQDPSGHYWVEIQDHGDSTLTIVSHARAGLQEKVIEAVVERQEEGVYRNGIFAGNSSGDPSYVLDLSGRLAQADQVHGDVYSGGSVAVRQDAQVLGTIRAVHNVTGNGSSSAETGKRQAIPDLAGMAYESTADVKVASEFATGGAAYAWDDAGGSAWQLPEANPAHIFRKNPSDRARETGGTVKDDYFLEDPYETVGSDAASDGTNAFGITLSGVSGEPGASSNRKVFFIDGNLWIHNYKTMSLKFQHGAGSGIQVTFVVKGNLYISDNLFYSNNAKDGVAFVAMKDAAVSDSGNIYFGDPSFGTLERMYAYLYAENDFLDVNLSATGSAKVELYGNMTAGNQVRINRDAPVKPGVTQHSKLLVDFDERLAEGNLDMPGLPRASAEDSSVFEVLSWREVGH